MSKRPFNAPEPVGPIDPRRNPAQRAATLQQAYNQLPNAQGQRPQGHLAAPQQARSGGFDNVANLARQTVGSNAPKAVNASAQRVSKQGLQGAPKVYPQQNQPLDKLPPLVSNAPKSHPDYLRFINHKEKILPKDWSIPDHGDLLVQRAPYSRGSLVDDSHPMISKVYISNDKDGGALWGRSAYQSYSKLAIPPGASPEFERSAREAHSQERFSAAWQVGQGLLDTLGDIDTLHRLRKNFGGAGHGTSDPFRSSAGGNNTDDYIITGKRTEFNGLVAPEIGKDIRGKRVPAGGGAEYTYDPKSQRLGVRTDSGAQLEFRSINGVVRLMAPITEAQVAKLEVTMRADAAEQAAKNEAAARTSAKATQTAPDGATSAEAASPATAGGGEQSPGVPPRKTGIPGEASPGDDVSRTNNPEDPTRTGRSNQHLTINRPKHQSLRVDFTASERPEVERFVEQVTGRSLAAFVSAGARSEAQKGDLFTAVLAGLGSSTPAPDLRQPLVIRDKFQGREAMMVIDKGRVTINLDTGITDKQAVTGVPRLDSAILRDGVFKTRGLRDETVNLYAALTANPQIAGQTPPIGQASLQAFLTFPLGKKVGAGSENGQAPPSPTDSLLPRDLRNPIAYLQALNDVRKSRDDLIRDGNYLVDLNRAHMIKQQANQVLGARGVVNLFGPLDALTPFAKNEQRVYFAPQVAATEGGVKIDRSGQIKLNVDQMPDGTFRLKPGTQLTLDFREANNAQPGYVMQGAIAGLGYAAGGPVGAAAASAVTQLGLSVVKQTDRLAALSSNGYNKVLTSNDVLPAFFVNALNDAANKPNVFRDFTMTDAAIGTVVNKYAPDRPIVFARFQPEGPTRINGIGYGIPQIRDDGITGSTKAPDTTQSLLNFFKVRDYQLSPIERADLQARLNAAVGADGMSGSQGLLNSDGRLNAPALGATDKSDPDGRARLELGERGADKLAYLYRMFPGFSVLHLDVRGGGVNSIDRDRRMELLGNDFSSGGARLERPELARRTAAQTFAFQTEVRRIGDALNPAFIGPRLPPATARFGQIDSQAADIMRRALAETPVDSSLFARNQIDPIRNDPATRNDLPSALAAAETLYNGAAVTPALRGDVQRYLDRVSTALPAAARPEFERIRQSVLDKLVDGAPASARTLDTLDTVRLSIEAANPQSADRNVAEIALRERERLTQINDQRRAGWEMTLSPAFRQSVPDWEARIADVTGGILPPTTGDYAHEIKANLQNLDPRNLTSFHLRINAADYIPKSPAERIDRPYLDFDVNQDQLYGLLDDRVRADRREQAIKDAGLDRWMYVGPRNEDHKFNFMPPVIERRFINDLDPYSLVPTPGAEKVTEPQPLSWSGKKWDIVHVDGANGEILIAPSRANDLFISQYDLLNQTVDRSKQRVKFREQDYQVAKINTQSDANGFTLAKLDKDGKVDPDAKSVFVPQFSLAEISLERDGQRYRVVGTSWTQVQLQADVPIQRFKPLVGQKFQAFIDDRKTDARASGGAVELRVASDRRSVQVTASDNPTIPVGSRFDLNRITPTVLSKSSQHLTGEHLADMDYVVTAGSPVAVRTADILTHLNRASPAPGNLGALRDVETEVVSGQRSFDSAADFINGYRDKVPPLQLTVQNVVYEFMTRTDSGKSASPILDAINDFRRRYPDTPIVLYSSNAPIATKLAGKKGTLDRTMAELEKINVEFRSRTPTGRPQTTHAKNITILGGNGGSSAALITTSGFEPRDRVKADINFKFGGDDARLFALYNKVSTYSDTTRGPVNGLQQRFEIATEAVSRYPDLLANAWNPLSQDGMIALQDRLAGDLARRGVMMQDPTVERSYVHASFRDLITSKDPADKTIIAQVRELRMPSMTAMLIDEARKGKQVFIQASVFDRRSFEMLQDASRSLPNLQFERIGGKSDPSNYAHFNLMATESKMAVATGYLWDSMQNASSEQPSSEGGVVLLRTSEAYQRILNDIKVYQKAVGAQGYVVAAETLQGLRSFTSPEPAPMRPGSLLQGMRLNMQLKAEQAAGVPMPTKITSWSDHVERQIMSRDGGIGVSRAALKDAFENPLKINYQSSRYGPTFQFVGKYATIAINAEGKVTAGWANNRAGAK